MRFALWYNKLIKAWYLLDWSRVSHHQDIITAPYDVAVTSTKEKPFASDSGGFRWDECGAVHFFENYPAREIQSIKLGRKRFYSVKPKIIKSK